MFRRPLTQPDSVDSPDAVYIPATIYVKLFQGIAAINLLTA